MVVLCVGVAREATIYLSTDCKRPHVISKKTSDYSKLYGGIFPLHVHGVVDTVAVTNCLCIENYLFYFSQSDAPRIT